MKTKPILFMGTPDFAAAALDAMIKDGYRIVGVVTQPDKPKGRGHQLTPPPVKVLAQANGLAVYQPNTLKDGAFDQTLNELSPALIVVAAYGKILPASLIHFPKHGCINIHGSLLPAYRGAAPIQRALMDGVKETGITIMQMDEGLDTGDMLYQLSTPITDEDNFETLHDRLALLGARALLESLPAILCGEIQPQKQDDSLANYAKKIEKEDCAIDFSKSAREVFLTVRSLSPIPLAYAVKDGEGVKIPCARVGQPSGRHGEIGEVISLAGGVVTVACGEGTIELVEVLPLGKKRMKASDWINGRKVAVGDRFDCEMKDRENG